MNLFAVTIPIRQTVNVKYTSVGPLVSDALGLALSVGSVFAFGYLVYGGVQWILGSGDKTKIEEARGRITQAVMGLIIVAASWAIFLFISNFLDLGSSGGSSWTPNN